MAQSPLYGGGRRYDYRDRLASSLLAEGSSGAPIQSGWQGAARLAQALMGGYLANKGEEDRQNEQRQYTQGLVSAFAPEQVLQPGAGGAGPRPDAQMVTRQPDPGTIAQRLFATNNPQLAGMAANMQMQEAAARQAREQAANQPFNLRPGEVRMGPNGQIIANNPVAAKPERPDELERLFLEAGLQPGDPRRAQYANQILQNKTTRPERPEPQGSEMERVRRIVFDPNANPASPEYQAAYFALTQPRDTFDPATGRMVTIRPELPPNVRAPIYGNQQQTAAAPAPQAQQPAMPQPAPASPPQAGQVAPPAMPAPAAQPQPGAPRVTSTQIAPPRERDLTEAQAKANLFGGQMLRAESLLSELKAPSNAAIIAWRNAPESAVNLGLSENDQGYFNALRLFASGILRKETGAAFAPGELLDVQSRYFPMPGDTPRIAAQKAANRKQAQESIRSEMPGGEFRGVVPQPPVYGSQDMQGGGQAAPGTVRTWNPATGQLE